MPLWGMKKVLALNHIKKNSSRGWLDGLVLREHAAVAKDLAGISDISKLPVTQLQGIQYPLASLAHYTQATHKLT